MPPLRSSMVLSAVLLSAACSPGSGAVFETERPNIVILYTDDHGFADLGCQGILEDITSPHTDRLAAEGVRFSAGYCSAPVCKPSRAGLLTGRYQNRFGLEGNGDNALPWAEHTLAERLSEAGYITGMCGKWHLHGTVASDGERPDGSRGPRVSKEEGTPRGLGPRNPGQAGHHGFEEYLSGSRDTYVASHTARGKPSDPTSMYLDSRYRTTVMSEWATHFIQRHAGGPRPFFLYVAYYAPHLPLEAPDRYLERISLDLPRRRRLALGMLAAVDDSVGEIMDTLEEMEVADDTLLFYISDNGASIKMDEGDVPGTTTGWNGSLNDPWIGEKLMLSEGGIRVPFLLRWPRRLSGAAVFERPVITLDATATALVAAGLELDERIDGVDLMPFLNGELAGDPHDALYWRFKAQAAIREGDWKYLQLGERRFLFDVGTPPGERVNHIEEEPGVADRLRGKLESWSETLLIPGLEDRVTEKERRLFDYYFGAG